MKDGPTPRRGIGKRGPSRSEGKSATRARDRSGGRRSARHVAPVDRLDRYGLVVAARRRHFTVLLDDGEVVDCVLKGRRTVVACGDRARVARIAGGGAIESVEPRTSLLYRSDAFRESVLAANVTQVVAVVAPDVAIDENLLNRWIVAAELERCRFALVANKSDLPGFDALRERVAPYRAMGYTVVECAAKRSAAPLADLVRGERSVLIGQSGMGKSTILNALVPNADARVGIVSQALGSGRHTTTETALFLLPGDADGWLVDSPGMKVFGIAHAEPDALAGAFVEMRPFLGRCRFRDCRHDREPGCAVLAAVDDGRIAPQRLALLHALWRESVAARDPAR
ncbi:ribosome biogenesis GTPase / thiamine phosphate phosphatase [Burkholderiales bacterium]|nr:ribosome biogenesis GTPase / thiamine phosphate phosphatase [Burkholderiales bacterium]